VQRSSMQRSIFNVILTFDNYDICYYSIKKATINSNACFVPITANYLLVKQEFAGSGKIPAKRLSF